MPEPLAFNAIERLARALLAALSPATGVRATGAITVTALPGAEPVELPANTYLRPIVGGQLIEALYKTTVPTPGDVWTVLPAAPESGIAITSNVGGARHNLPAGTVFRFDPVPDGLAPTATLDADMVDGSDAGALVRSVAFFEELDAANPEKDIFASILTTPAIMLVWTMSEPAEGALGGLRQGANRGSRSVKFWRENYVLYVVTARLASDTARRQEGLIIAQAATRLLTDRMRNDDGEQLSSVGGGVEVIGRARYRRDARRYIYALRLRVNQTLEPVLDGRVFQRWLRTQYVGAAPGGEPPEPIQDLVVVDTLEPMP
jgi:hypothetical protein